MPLKVRTPTHPCCGQTSQFIINQRQQLLSSLAITLLHPTQNKSDFGHDVNVQRRFGKSEYLESAKTSIPLTNCVGENKPSAFVFPASKSGEPFSLFMPHREDKGH
jgi:hypothetical protein